MWFIDPIPDVCVLPAPSQAHVASAAEQADANRGRTAKSAYARHLNSLGCVVRRPHRWGGRCKRRSRPGAKGGGGGGGGGRTRASPQDAGLGTGANPGAPG